jgi:hypothetical protein
MKKYNHKFPYLSLLSRDCSLESAPKSPLPQVYSPESAQGATLMQMVLSKLRSAICFPSSCEIALAHMYFMS